MDGPAQAPAALNFDCSGLVFSHTRLGQQLHNRQTDTGRHGLAGPSDARRRGDRRGTVFFVAPDGQDQPTA